MTERTGAHRPPGTLVPARADRRAQARLATACAVALLVISVALLDQLDHRRAEAPVANGSAAQRCEPLPPGPLAGGPQSPPPEGSEGESLPPCT